MGNIMLQDLNTFDEVSNLGLDWAFLQVLHHHVGNSRQVTHVSSSGTTVSPETHRLTFTTRAMLPAGV